VSENYKNNYRNIVQLLNIEADAIRVAANRLDAETAEKAISLLVECTTKIVLLGVGKSGIIANKIADTLTSTGTVAVFLHPTDALHGSLGIITKGDVVIALSNSGETDEIITLLPALRQREVAIIAIVGNPNSTLARQSDIALDASVAIEACPLNLAPTTSTTVALAIGDAFAMTLMQLKGISEEEFAANHPAGRLGKRLTLKVRDLMQRSPNILQEATWLDVVKSISKFALGAVNVVDSEGKLIGIVTDGDLRRAIETHSDLANLTALQMMTKNPTTTTSQSLAFDALKLMENRPSQISVLPVVDENGISIGLLRIHDIVKSGL
jgi:arabinose-5-phosphate isomerase